MENLSPMLKQYHDMKSKHQDCILFFRLGDFYEMFYDDAKAVAKTLDLVLTSRGKAPSQKVPMCGFPYHSAQNYIARLITKGFKVAICEQVEDPAKAKGIVKRDVTRVITSGTYLDENSPQSRYLVCLSPNAKKVGLSFADPTIGTIQTNQYPLNTSLLANLMAKLPIYECVFPESEKETVNRIFEHPHLKLKNITLSPYEDWCFNPDIAHKSLCEHFEIANLHGFGIEDLNYATASTGALLDYLKKMNKQPLRHIDKVSLYQDDEYAFISPAAHHGLELYTLINELDATLTPLGKRKFLYWFYHPLKQSAEIELRQEATILLNDANDTKSKLSELLKAIPDIEKNISRLSCGYTHAKDLLAIRNTLAMLPELIKLTAPLKQQNNLFVLNDIPELRKQLYTMISEDIPLSKPEGKIIREGFSKELDDLRSIQNNAKDWLKQLLAKEIKRTGISSLKINFNKVFGYYLEVTKTHLKSVPADYIRKQTLVNAERFITPQLKEYEDKILTAQDKIVKLESELVSKVQKLILDHSIELHNFCQSIATLDVLYAFSEIAQRNGYCQPDVSGNSILDIKEGRHPVVERMITEDFIGNNSYLDCEENHLIILTGPNMAGKSTYIRQTALLVIMAQVGCFIPAKSAHIGIVDKVFTRIGAHDDIAKGQSTFMVEMNETADILNNMTDHSLVILDEIGRGTSTYDGLSLAWALAEHFHQRKARTLFATHFHELTALADKHTGIKNYNVAVKEWKDKIIFLHKIVPGSTDDSYGIYVAKLAGIPNDVIARSRQILTQLELKSDLKENLKTNYATEQQIDLFNATSDPLVKEVKNFVKQTDINKLTPLEALNRWAELQNVIENDT